MFSSTEYSATIARVLVLGFLLTTLMAMLLSTATPADAAPASGRAFSWGENDRGQLGNGNTGTNTNTPGAVSNLKGVTSTKAGCDHGLALMNDGTVRAWGKNLDGQLGNGTNADSTVPVQVNGLTDVKSISAGCFHSMALKNDGTVWTWGDNFFGPLGNGTNADSNVPVQVNGLTGATDVAAGRHFSLALMQDGTVRSWGYNSNGNLGNNTTDHRNTPAFVSQTSGVTAIATDASAEHSLALLNDGAVKAWGFNVFGQIGDGTSGVGTEKKRPVVVGNLSGVKALAAGAYHSLALMNDGTVKAWGFNEHGQLGIGTSGSGDFKSTPTDVPGLTKVKSLSSGGYHSLAILGKGKARSWGDNEYGQLGNGNTGTDSNVPVAVKLKKAKQIDGGEYFTLAAKN